MEETFGNIVKVWDIFPPDPMLLGWLWVGYGLVMGRLCVCYGLVMG